MKSSENNFILSLNSSIDCLKVGGKLFISVPNNNSFLGLDHLNVLNQPPHHMGLWDRKSLYHLQRFFPLRLDDLFLEPPQIYHKEYCTSIINSVMSSVWANKFGVVGKLFRKIYKKMCREIRNRYNDNSSQFK